MSQQINVAYEPIHAHIKLPGSTSITNRALFLASLAQGVSELSGIKLNVYTKDFIYALRQAGVAIQLDEKSASCIIAGCGGNLPKKQTTIWLGQSKTALRNLLAVCAANPGVYYLDGKISLRELVLTDYLTILFREGIQIIPSGSAKLPFTLIGVDSLEGGDIVFNGTTTHQLISSLLMIAPFTRSAMTFTLPDLQKQYYLDMTCTMMAEFGVLVHRLHHGQFVVPVPQRYQARDYTIEPDFGIASYFWGAAAVTAGELTIQPTKRALSKQIESQFLTILEKMGCHILESHKGLTVKGPNELRGIDITLKEDMIDAFYTLVAIAPFANSQTRIAFSGNNRDKQIRLISAGKKLLEKLNIPVEGGELFMTITPSLPRGGVIDCKDNPRFAMAGALTQLKILNLVLLNTKSASKIYPEFFSLWNQITEKAFSKAE